MIVIKRKKSKKIKRKNLKPELAFLFITIRLSKVKALEER